VTISAVETARQVVEYDREMTNRVSELSVPLMDTDELRQIIDNGPILLNVDLRALREDVVQYSVGQASVCRQIALKACLERDVMTTQLPALVRWARSRNFGVLRSVPISGRSCPVRSAST